MKKSTVFLLTLVSNTVFAAGETLTDGSVGNAQNFGSGSFTVPQALGTTLGNNLFHSFAKFNVNSGQTATFTGSSQLQNVISRVTGGEISNIHGTIRSEIGKADFYLINPAGVVFGNNASVEVPAAFHVSTADQLQFKDGAVFSAVTPRASHLSSATPVEFGFLGSSVKNNGLLAINGAQLSVAPNQTIDIVAGAIGINSSETQNAQLNAPSGAIRLVAVQGKAGVAVDNSALPELQPTAFNAGDIIIDGRSGSATLEPIQLNTTGNGGGRFSLWGNNAQFFKSYVLSDNIGGDLAIQKKVNIIADYLRLSDDSMISFSSRADQGSGDAGHIDIQARNLEILDSKIFSSTWTNGAAGHVKVVADQVTIRGGSALSAPENLRSLPESAPARPGIDNTDQPPVNIDDKDNTLVATAPGIFSNTLASGAAGNIDIQTKTLAISQGGNISSNTSADGKAGLVNVIADNLKIEGRGSNIASNANSGRGDAGNVNVQAKTLAIWDGGIISSETSANGNAGTVVVKADALNIEGSFSAISSDARANSQGHAGIVEVTADHIRIDAQASAVATDNGLASPPAGIISSTFGSGNAGQIHIKAQTLAMFDGAIVSTKTSGIGDAGLVKVEANHLQVNGRGTSIDSSAKEGKGDAGNVYVQAETLAISQGGIISSETFTDGNAGAVSVMTDDLNITGNGGGISSDANRGSRGDAGNVNVQAKTLAILDGGIISSETSANGNAGTVVVKADALNIEGSFSAISSDARANSQGHAGIVEVTADNIKIDAQASAVATASGLASPPAGIISSTFGSGNAGQIHIKAQTLAMFDGAIVSTKTSGIGDAGLVKVEADHLQVNGRGTSIDSSAAAGNGDAGNIDIQVKTLEILNQGKISSNTFAQGKAGVVTVDVDKLKIDGRNSSISSAANGEVSSGRTGDVLISAHDSIQLFNGASINAKNEAIVSNTSNLTASNIVLTAPEISLQNGGEISTDSSGNIAASNITLNAGEHVGLDASFVTTTANSGNGGIITLNGQAAFNRLTNSGLITTVRTSGGNGGDININSDILVMDTAVIQANAQSGRGGAINVNVNALIPSGSMLIKGGRQLEWQANLFGFNVVQAASATGINGELNFAAPQLNLSGVLAHFGQPQFESKLIEQNDCDDSVGSSLTRVGQGGLPRKRSESWF